MNKYQTILRIFVASIAYLGALFLGIGVIYYLSDVTLNDTINIFFSKKTMPIIIILMVLFIIIGSFEIYIIIRKRKMKDE